MDRSWQIVLGVVIALLVILCCLCVAVLALTGLIATRVDTSTGFEPPAELFQPSPTPRVVRPTEAAGEDMLPPADASARTLADNLRALEQAQVPINDPRDLARRLGGQGEVPLTVPAVTEPPAVGDRENFWVTNVDNNESFQIEAVLRYVGEHIYFWIEDGVRYDDADLVGLATTFETDILPTNRAFFGSEWSPGVDGDPRLYILFARGLGGSLAGYFSSVDELHPLAHEYSNAHEMFLLSADNLDLGEEYTQAVLAHEYQHMIHWYRDRNEETWLNEGFSELAAFLNGFDLGGFDALYALDPDLQLNDWPNDPSATTPHYGASSLFVTYFLDRFGPQITQALVAAPENGLTSIDVVLEESGAQDPETGQPVSADDVFMDWVLASYLLEPGLAGGRYAYRNYPAALQPVETERVDSCPTGQLTRDVRQYGVDYIAISCRGEHTLSFVGSTQVAVVPAAAHSGDYAFWSNKGDESDMTLTRSFDFRDQGGPLTLEYWTWYDIEEDYDYVYLVASTDGGETWDILTTPSGTAEDPSGNSYGWGYNGLSGGGPEWIKEQVDLSAYAGEEVLLRFEYITDAAVNGEGFLLDDVSIPETGYAADFESDDGGWEAAGFVRLDNVLPQYYRLALISRGETTTVEHFTLEADNTLTLPIEIGGAVDEVVLVVTGTTRFTRQPAAYQYQIGP